MTPAFDTNIIIYAFATGVKADIARALMAAGGVITVQNLNEFTNVAVRKLDFSWEEIAQAVDHITTLCGEPRAIDLSAHHDARAIAERYQLSFYDALIVAAALGAGCTTLYSEDMQDGMVVEGRLTIINPFAALA
ncbi:MAG: hypothetical protein RLZZ58_2079 [Pseudomonadota bacterium]